MVGNFVQLHKQITSIWNPASSSAVILKNGRWIFFALSSTNKFYKTIIEFCLSQIGPLTGCGQSATLKPKKTYVSTCFSCFNNIFFSFGILSALGESFWCISCFFAWIKHGIVFSSITILLHFSLECSWPFGNKYSIFKSQKQRGFPPQKIIWNNFTLLNVNLNI